MEAKDGARVNVYHYTIGDRLEQIVSSGEIRPAVAGVTRGERPAVWFSTNPEWEETANKPIMDKRGRVWKGNRETTREMGGGLVRIAVLPEAAPHTWEAFRRLSGISPRMADALERAARIEGASPDEWRVSFGAVPRAQWIDVEVWTETGWVSALK